MTADALAFVAITATLAAVALAAMLVIATKANEDLAAELRTTRADLRIERAHTASFRQLADQQTAVVRYLPTAVAGRMVWPDEGDGA